MQGLVRQPRLLFDLAGEAADQGQRRADLVADRGHHLAQDGQALALAHLLGQVALLAQVAHDGGEQQATAHLGHANTQVQGEAAAIAALAFHLGVVADKPGLAGSQVALHIGAVAPAVFFREQGR